VLDIAVELADILEVDVAEKSLVVVMVAVRRRFL